ncbi:DUF1192 domain-containing protein [Roseibium denhamense]|uniref:Uncharacterized small protein, DUF1192 family n=1 Tax=Roseibium denhamense TaxID=76305 RepID=A0ABY1NJP8_9HYPH|nr:DUF1192 domain-containing protein [Roseibium denhamense]MTI06801.1 DUF1192 domain-containing protein [Roseibium denhamense]SMP11439.1 Uncharacterized small protein, DUF1192 family [Roseibium denhamense]
MGLFDEDVPKKSPFETISVGDNLERLSEDELAERIKALKGEIERTQAALEQRGNIRNAADAFFKK